MTAIMSEGISPYDFVQQVYYMQEKTLLDFWPSDDKYREVLVEANLVLRELEAQQDWTWLRETLVLGENTGGNRDIVEFVLPDDVYKLSLLNHDSIRLYPRVPHVVTSDEAEAETYLNSNGENASTGEIAYLLVDDELVMQYDLVERFVQHVPIASAGDQRWNREQQVNMVGVNHIHDYRLRAVIHGHTIKMNRLLFPRETRLVAVVDVQKHIVPFHVCNQTCWNEHKNNTVDSITSAVTASSTCSEAASVYLREIPDPNYVIMATAARHAEGSPPALARVAGLQDAAQRILSQMRQNDADATDSDYIEWDLPGYVEVI